MYHLSDNQKKINKIFGLLWLFVSHLVFMFVSMTDVLWHIEEEDEIISNL